MEESINNIAIIQARMSSSRLPGKVLMPLADYPVLHHVYERVKKSKFIDKIIIATSIDNSDDPISEWCKARNIDFFRGSLTDVLDRFYQVAKLYKAKNILRITADCPVLDYKIIDEVILEYNNGDYDYYGLKGQFPDGLDCTMISYFALKSAWENSILSSEREHVGPYIEKHPELFKLGGLEKFTDLGHFRWTLDEAKDYELLNYIFNALYQKDNFFTHELILELYKQNVDLMKINQNILRNEGYQKSIKNENINIYE
jgi:spore coat polysaccharide biosynthesis protein SpsF